MFSESTCRMCALLSLLFDWSALSWKVLSFLVLILLASGKKIFQMTSNHHMLIQVLLCTYEKKSTKFEFNNVRLKTFAFLGCKYILIEKNCKIYFAN